MGKDGRWGPVLTPLSFFPQGQPLLGVTQEWRVGQRSGDGSLTATAVCNPSSRGPDALCHGCALRACEHTHTLRHIHAHKINTFFLKFIRQKKNSHEKWWEKIASGVPNQIIERRGWLELWGWAVSRQNVRTGSDVVPCAHKAFGTGGFHISRKRNGCFVLTGELALPVLLVWENEMH